MRGYMFRNRWLALLFVGVTLAGVTRLVGTEDHDGAIQAATAEIAEQQARAARLTDAAPAVASSEPAADPAAGAIPFAPDEALIDPATGDDPTPVDEFAAAQAAEAAGAAPPAVVLVSPVTPPDMPAEQ